MREVEKISDLKVGQRVLARKTVLYPREFEPAEVVSVGRIAQLRFSDGSSEAYSGGGSGEFRFGNYIRYAEGHLNCTGERKPTCSTESESAVVAPDYLPEGPVYVRLMKETQKTISDWAVQTFGDAGTNASCATRMNKEVAELLMCLANDDRDPKAGEECADVLICLYRIAERLGVNLLEQVDRKMKINREREWKLDGHGHGYHKKPAEKDPSKDESGWLIERQEGGRSVWWRGWMNVSDFAPWTTDAGSAVRFTREQDAERVRDVLHRAGFAGMKDAIVTDHGWTHLDNDR